MGNEQGRHRRRNTSTSYGEGSMDSAFDLSDLTEDDGTTGATKTDDKGASFGIAISNAIQHALDYQRQLLVESKGAAAEDTMEDSEYHHKETFSAPTGSVAGSTAHAAEASVLGCDYAPKVFRTLRRKFGVSDASYRLSLCAQALEGVGQGAGASGSIFFLSADKRYVIKSLPKKETDQLRDLLKFYYSHMSKNPDSLLPKFFGMYKVKCGKRWIRLVVMNNAFHTQLPVHEKYDLKGSKVNRSVSDKRQAEVAQRGEVAVLKDSDLQRNIWVAEQERELLIGQAHRDGHFLCSHGIMDYSLLLGIHNVDADDAIRADFITAPARAGAVATAPENSGNCDTGPHNSQIDAVAAAGEPSSSASSPPVSDEQVLSWVRAKLEDLGDVKQVKYQTIKRQVIAEFGFDVYETSAGSIRIMLENFCFTHNVKSRWQRHCGGMKALTGTCSDDLQPAVVYIAVIDVLQQWNMNKKMENLIKVSLRYGHLP